MESSFSASQVDELDKVIAQVSEFEAEQLNGAGKLLESLGWDKDTMRLAHYAGTGKRAIQLLNDGMLPINRDDDGGWLNVFETDMKMPTMDPDWRHAPGDFTIKMTAQWLTPPPHRG